MARAFKVFASYLQFKEVLDDPLGHLYRAGEFDAEGSSALFGCESSTEARCRPVM